MTSLFRDFLILLLTACCSACEGPVGPVLEVAVHNPGVQLAALDVTARRVRAGVSEQTGPDSVSSHLELFRVQLPIEFRGEVELEVVGLDRDGCQVGVASTKVAISADQTYYLDITLNHSEHGCQLIIDKDSLGTVTSVPEGISCGDQCSSRFQRNAQVTLTASEDLKSMGYFLGWSGDCSGTGSCVVQISSNTKHVQANFALRTVCSADQFCWENPLPLGNALSRVYGFSNNDIWAIGDAGTISRFNGTFWRNISVTTNSLKGIFGVNASDVWIVGSKGTLLRWNGRSFRTIDSDQERVYLSVWGWNDQVWIGDKTGRIVNYKNGILVSDQNISTGAIFDIWGFSENDIWAVAVNIKNNSSEIYHFDGSRWNLFDRILSESLIRLWGSGPNDIWFTGTKGWHYDGKTLPSMSTPILSKGNIVWGTSTSDIWIGRTGSLFHFDSSNKPPSEWSSDANTTLYSIWGDNRDSYWAVGAGGVIIHWNGSSWGRRTSGELNPFTGISGQGKNDIWVSGGGEGVLYHYSTFWQKINIPMLSTLYAIESVSSNEIWLAGSNRLILWNGTAGFEQETKFSAIDNENILGIKKVGDRLWYVGGYAGDSVTPSYGYIGHLDKMIDGKWKASVSNKLQYLLFSIWNDENGNVWAVGGNAENRIIHGAVYKYDFNTDSWSLLKNDFPVMLSGVWGTNRDDLWVVGGVPWGIIVERDIQGIWHFDGSTWTGGLNNNSPMITAISGSGPDNIWVAGEAGYVAKLNNGVPIELKSGTRNNLSGVWVNSNDVWLVGDSGTILHRHQD